MISREKQKEILQNLSKLYPGNGTFRCESVEEERELAENLMYLEEHGLCVSGLQLGLDGHIMLGASSITAKGLDFLADDGGLSAILGVVTVKLHADTIRDLIAAKIETSVLPAEQKDGLKKKLAALPEAALRAATTDLVKNGLDHLPDIAHWLGRLAGF